MATMRRGNARATGEEMSMQRVLEIMRGLQDDMAESKLEQERMQADLEASHARNEELRRVNEELRQGLRNNPGQREPDEMEHLTPPREFSTPFSQEILDAAIPNTFAGPKVIFTGMEDPEAHLTAFHTQMVLVGGSDAARCRLFMSTLTGMAMDWFISLPNGHITSFQQLSQLFREQYLANRAPPPVSYDIFDVKQYQGESLKEYINRFGAQVVKTGTSEEPMIVYAFRKGVSPGPFCESTIRNRPRTFAEIRRRAVEHIASEGELDELVRSSFLKDYVAEPAETPTLPAPTEEQAHEMPVLGEVHTIAGGFSGGGPTASQRKKYARGVNSIEERISGEPWESDLVFTRGDLRDVVPHDNDPVVISVVTTGRKVHRVLVDQGSSADVMFLSTFNKLRLSPDLLRPYTGCLYGFADNQVEVRGYLELRTTFTDGEASRTESIRYLVVNAHSAYNILLGRPALNRLNAVSSTRHMKMKLPNLSGKVIVIKSDQEEARKCYENSLKSRKSVFMVFERPPSVDATGDALRVNAC
ncbi:uncharacterized protein [Phaseolus vulgaris]|uniref:uncharacterized protein n=1 Tax=Phaseolus vulgaris TaxID=3885 RepID=UPI0035C9F35F